MLDCHWEVHELDAAPPGRTGAEATTLVAAVVANRTPTPRRVRLVPRFEGAIHPPRRHGLPEAGWTDEGFEGVVDGGRAGDDERGPTPTELLRDLGSPAPPRDAVPAGDGDPTAGEWTGKETAAREEVP